MKTLNLHCDYIKFKALKKALKSIDEIAPNQKLKGEAKECLVVLVAVEKEDSKQTIKELVNDIKKIAEDVKTSNIVLYPYAHLSNNLGKPEKAVEILNETAKKLKPLKVIQAPFGYYKTLELKVKGHPLSELSREFKIKGNEEKAELSKDERKRLLRTISRATLDTSKLKDNDHRILGSKMNLWSFNNIAPGMVFWHPKGLHIKNKLIEYWREIHRRTGYEEISTPQIMERNLWEISGHWLRYGENNFKTKYEGRDFLVKPMNCPGGMLVYKTSTKSYRDLPLRVGELGIIHRVELSGVLAGLFRLIQFTQDDAHIFCTEKQLEGEVSKIIDLIKEIFGSFKIKIDHIELSTRPKKRIGSDKIWDLTERAQCSTIQLDMALPERFNLIYSDDKGNEKRPIMLHRVIFGSIERFIGILTEHLNGKFPLWLSPNQIKLMTLNDDVKDYAKEVYQKLFDEGFQVEINDKSESMGKKARDAQIQRFNYLITVGEKEKSKGKIAVRARDSKEIVITTLNEFISKIKKEISSKTL